MSYVSLKGAKEKKSSSQILGKMQMKPTIPDLSGIEVA